MAERTYIGVDPGVTTGVAVLVFQDGTLDHTHSLHVSNGLVYYLIKTLVGLYAPERTTVAIEEYVVSARAGKTRNSRDGVITRTALISARSAAEGGKARVVTRRAAEVKPWATDERLEAAGIKTIGKHATDAARHALYCAVHDHQTSDPLAKK